MTRKGGKNNGDQKERQRNEQGTEGIVVIGGTDVTAKNPKKKREQIGDKTMQHNAQRQRNSV